MIFALAIFPQKICADIRGVDIKGSAAVLTFRSTSVEIAVGDNREYFVEFF